MAGYALRRLALFAPTLLGVVTLVFFLGHALPGDPVDLMLGETASPAARETLRRSLGLDRPLAVQCGRYVADLASGRLGVSLRTGRPVAEELGRAFPYTLRLGTAAMALSLLAGLALGLAGAGPGLRRRRAADLLMGAGLSLPSFFLGPVLLLALAVHWPLFPVSGAGETGSLVLPAFTLAVPTSALLGRVACAALRGEVGADYLRTALSKGLGGERALLRHALPNAALPLVTVAGLQFGSLLTGAILTEKIFRWPGLGTLVLTAISSRDYPVVQGAVLLFAVVTLAVNLATDLLYGLLDPRVRHGG